MIDVQAHYVAEDLVRRVREGAFAPTLTAERVQDGFAFRFPTGLGRKVFPKITDLEQRVKHMDQCGVDVEVLATWVEIFGYDLPREVAVSYHTLINEGLAEAVKAYPNRFRFIASVPLPWMDESVSVLRDAAKRLGAKGTMIGTNVAGVNLDDPRLEPFWSESEEMDLPVVLHPVSVAGQERMKSYYLHNLIGNPFDTTIAAASLIFGGVLDRHPRLKVVLLHGGGYLPYAIGRLDHGFQVRSEAKTAKNTPSYYLKRFYYDSVVFHPQILRTLSLMVETKRILLGTDYPFDMEPKDAVGMIRSIFRDEADMIFESNPKTLFAL